MKIINKNLHLGEFNTWSGATETKNTIIEEGKEDDFEALINDLYPDGLTATKLNDFLWFEDDFIFENIGIEVEA